MTVNPALGYVHHLEQGTDKRFTLLLLHGTGGDEFDLVPLARHIAGDNVTLLSPRGDVNENGQLRFFKRFADGSFDQDDLVMRTNALADFITKACAEYGIDQSRLFALGYSNGANMIGSLMLRRPEVLAGGLMLRAMPPKPPEALPQLDGKKLLILSGVMDPLLPVEQGEALGNLLRGCGADVTWKSMLAGHELRDGDLTTAKEWLEQVV